MDELTPKTIYEFPSASTLSGTEFLAVMQAGVTKKLQIKELFSQKTLNDKKILLIGDSYNHGTGGTTGRGWGYYFKQINGVNATIIHQNTGGFAAVANSANASYNNCNYAQVIDRLQASANYDLIVAQSGWNDASTSKNPDGVVGIQRAVEDFITKCNTKWPGCEILVVATNNDTVCDSYKVSCLNAIVDTARDNNIRATRSSYLWLQGTGVNANDGIHLNNAGYQMLGRLISNYVNGWDGDLNNSYSSGSNCVAFAQGLKIAWGSVVLDSSGAGKVVFPLTYQAAPNVLCYVSGISQNYMFDARSGNLTTTGCDVVAVRLSGSSYGAASGYTIRWISIGI